MSKSPIYGMYQVGPFFAMNVYAEGTVASGEVHCYHGTWTLRKGWVAPKWRGHGFQRMLIKQRLEYAQKHGAKRVRTWVLPTNSYSLNNLVAEGFRFIHRKARVFDGKTHVGLEYQFS